MNMPHELPLIQGIHKRFGEHEVLRGATVSLAGEGITCLLGSSGCGKSTLLRVAAGLERADRGQVLVPAAECAMVFQDPRLLPWLTTGENLRLALPRRCPDAAERIEKALAMVELSPALCRSMPRELSGGMAQRVGVARALLRSPRILLMDEPFAALDAITREHLQNLLLDLWQRRRMSFILVTHNVAEAVFLGRYIMVMGQSPASKRLWLENPCFGNASCRNSDEYFSLIRQVRGALEENSRERLREARS